MAAHTQTPNCPMTTLRQAMWCVCFGGVARRSCVLSSRRGEETRGGPGNLRRRLEPGREGPL